MPPPFRLRHVAPIMRLHPPEPLDTAPYFAPMHEALMALLRGLSPEEWEQRATARWRVRDVAAHLLDGDLRKLSLGRDGHRMTPPTSVSGSERALVAWLNELNATWVDAAARLSPGVLTDLLAFIGPQLAAYVGSLDPDGPAPYPVAWAGEEESRMWMDVGREFTERWHHQQQIRDAVGARGLVDARWMRPVLDVSVRALPHAYRGVQAEEGTTVVLAVRDEGGGEWTLRREDGRWVLYEGAAPRPACTVAVGADTAWRVLLHALPRDVAASRVQVQGDRRLGDAFLDARAVMV